MNNGDLPLYHITQTCDKYEGILSNPKSVAHEDMNKEQYLSSGHIPEQRRALLCQPIGMGGQSSMEYPGVCKHFDNELCGHNSYIICTSCTCDTYFDSCVCV